MTPICTLLRGFRATLLPSLLASAVLAISAVQSVCAQNPDPLLPRVGIPQAGDSVPPLTPARAFLYSFALPGLSQSIMERPTAATIFVGVEVVGVAMLSRSIIDLQRARRFARDSVVESYRVNSSTGLVERDPDTGEPLVASYEVNSYREGLIRARKRHVEDWAAIVVFNHFLSAADALVAAHLWDLPGELRLGTAGDGYRATLSIPW